MVLDSQPWKCVEAVPAIAFSIDGLGAVRGREPARRGWLTIAEGLVDAVAEHHVGLEATWPSSFVVATAIDLGRCAAAK